jgi:DNA-directed RNA polymerase specialized sigma24 family protein
MADDPSITFWIDKLKAGDQKAAQPLWNRYFQHLVRLAYQRLRGSARAAADEEDVALSAFRSFCAAAEQGRFPVLSDRDDLWKLLVVITERKSLNLVRDQARLKRGGGLTAEDSPILANLVGGEPTPLFAAQMAEECQQLFDHLEDDILSKIAIDKMEGFTNQDIAARHGLALRTVERKLGLIRRIWEQQLSTEN